jgi:type I restriction-modification system DNA methylase subunit
MLTGEIRSQIDQIWNAFWSGGISNPLEVIEQITYLLFLKRLDEQEIAEELKANREKRPMQKRFFPEGKDSKKRSFQDYRWNRFKNTRETCMRWSASTSFPGSALWAAMARPTQSTWKAPASPFPRRRCWRKLWT